MNHTQSEDKIVAVIGLEIHCELNTKTKMFCSCKNEFSGDENQNCCPICLGFPGTLPVINKDAILLGLRAGVAFNCKINKTSLMDRKNYFYPDLPKSYQITQKYLPLCHNGYITLASGKRIGIERIHLEEDAGKLVHSTDGTTQINYNRCGVPLIEIVTFPELSNGEEAAELAKYVSKTVKAINVCDGKLQEGSFRVDVNVSVKQQSAKMLGTAVEIKNINSFKNIKKAIDFEIELQKNILSKGERIIRQTKRYDDRKGITTTMRIKEEESDYHFVLDTNIPPICLTDNDIADAKRYVASHMAKGEEQQIDEFCERYSLGKEKRDKARKIVKNNDLLNLFNELTNSLDIMSVINFLCGDLSAVCNKLSVKPKHFTSTQIRDIIKNIQDNVISREAGRTILLEIANGNDNVQSVIDKLELSQSCDSEYLMEIVTDTIKNNRSIVEQYKNGEVKVVSFLVGLVMKNSTTKLPPKDVKNCIEECLKKEKVVL